MKDESLEPGMGDFSNIGIYMAYCLCFLVIEKVCCVQTVKSIQQEEKDISFYLD